MEPRGYSVDDSASLRLRNRVIPRPPTAATRREPRSPRRRSPSEGEASAFSQAQGRASASTRVPGVGAMSGAGVPPMRGVGAFSTSTLPGSAGVAPSPSRMDSTVGSMQENVPSVDVHRRVAHLERLVDFFIQQRRGADHETTRPVVPAVPVHVPPPFSGHKPKSWLLQMEQYFAIIGLPDDERLTRIVCHLSGSALEHFNATAERNPMYLPTTWEDFKTYLIETYGSESASSVVSQIKEIKFTGSFRAVVNKFQEALAQGEQPPERQLVNLFITRFPWELAKLTRMEQFDTWVQARNFMEQQFRSFERLRQDYFMDAPEEFKAAARGSPELQALGLGGPPSKPKKEAEPRRFVFQNGRYEPRPKGGAAKDERPNGSTGGGGSAAPVKCFECSGTGHRAKDCPSADPATKREGHKCHRCGGAGHWAPACPTGREQQAEKAEGAQQMRTTAATAGRGNGRA